MIKSVFTALVLLALAILAGCVTTSGPNSPGFALESALRADPHATQLKPAALRKAVSTEIAALTNGQPGTLNNWRTSRDVEGVVIPGTPFEVSGRICRRYEHRISITGQERSRTATACRNDQGNWEPLT